jgi:hypothetical protein
MRRREWEETMAGRLKPLDVERQNKPGKYADGGLYLIVSVAPRPFGLFVRSL